jgi:hypothetical protein
MWRSRASQAAGAACLVKSGGVRVGEGRTRYRGIDYRFSTDPLSSFAKRVRIGRQCPLELIMFRFAAITATRRRGARHLTIPSGKCQLEQTHYGGWQFHFIVISDRQ